MFNIPLLDYFSYAEMEKKKGLFQILHHAGSAEFKTDSLIYNLIAQAILKYPEKKVIVSFETDNQKMCLYVFLKKHELSSTNVVLISTAEDFPKPTYLSAIDNKISGIFISNPNFFKISNTTTSNKLRLTDGNINSSNARSFLLKNKNIIVMTTLVRDYYSPVGIRNYSNQMYLASISLFLKDNKNGTVDVECLKNSFGKVYLPITYSVCGEKWLPKFDNLKEKNFFNLSLGTRGFSRSKPLFQNFINIEQFYLYFSTSKSIKKVLNQKSIISHFTDEYSFLELNYDYLNFYFLLKEAYSSSFNVDIFLKQINEEFYIDVEAVSKNFKFLTYLLKQTRQVNVIEWFKKENQQSLNDIFTMLNRVKEITNCDILLNNPKDLRDVHDQLMDILSQHDPVLDKEINSQRNLKKYDGLKINFLMNDEEEEVKICIPKTARDFKIIGTKMGLCIQNSWYWDQLKSENTYIIIFYYKSVATWCVKIDKNKNIIEAKARFNQKIPPEILVQIETALFAFN